MQKLSRLINYPGLYVCSLTVSGACSMWRLVCLAFFGVFAWAVTWDMYGAQVSAHFHRAVDAVQACTSSL